MVRAAEMSLIRDTLTVFKLRIGFAIMLSALAGIAISPGELPERWRIVLLACAVFLASASAGAFNQWVEADLDRSMARTAGRPFASSRFTPDGKWLALILVLLALAVALAGWAANAWAAFHTFMGAFVYGVIYTVWLKRRSWANIVIGGLAGSFAVLAGAAAVSPGLAVAPLLLALVLFLWTPPHFWSLAIAAHDDYARARVPMLPVVAGDRVAAWVILGHTLVLVAVSIAPVTCGMGRIYLAGAVLGRVVFIWTSMLLVLEPTRRRAIANFLASLLQLGALISGTLIERFVEGLA